MLMEYKSWIKASNTLNYAYMSMKYCMNVLVPPTCTSSLACARGWQDVSTTPHGQMCSLGRGHELYYTFPAENNRLGCMYLKSGLMLRTESELGEEQ